MKQSKTRATIVFFILLIFNICFAQQDSLKLIEIENRIKIIEGFQVNTRDALNNNLTAFENKINNDNFFINLALGVGISLNVFFIVSIILNAKKYVKKKLNEKFNNIIDLEESNIIELVDKHDLEKQILKNKKILVLTSKNGDDKFVRKFFKKIGFQIDNINYEKVDIYKSYDGYDLIFANNEDGTFSEELIQEYFEKSKENIVLFFFGKSFTKGQKVTSRMSYANSRTQIYGNLLNLLKYQEVLK